MSSIEERLARDIAAVTGGVVVTDSDLRDARNAVEDRIENSPRGDRRRPLAAALVAAVIIPVLGVAAFQSFGDDGSAPPANPGPTSPDPDDAFLIGDPPTPELVAGVWRVDNGTMLLKLTAAGEIRFDDGGQLFADPTIVGTYSISGDRIVVDVTGKPADCVVQQFAMRASLPESGAMRIVHTQPGSASCTPREGEQWVLEQVLPTNNRYLRGFDISGNEDWQPPADPTSLHGDWMAAVKGTPAQDGGGGHILEIAPTGAYYVADASGDLADRGRWTLDGSRAELSLVSDADSPACDQGDRLVLTGVEHMDPYDTTAMRSTVGQNTCGGSWAQEAWVLLPSAGD